MPPPADPALVAEAVRLVAEDGFNYSEAGRAVGLSWMTVRGHCHRVGVLSPRTRPDFALGGTEGRLTAMEAWEASEVPSPRTVSENAGNPRHGRNGGRPGLYVGFTGTGDGLPRPDLPEGAVLDAGGLQTAMKRWAGRVATATATDYVERNVHSSWEASTR